MDTALSQHQTGSLIIKITPVLKHNQRAATLYNVLYWCQRSKCFDQFFGSSSGAQKLYMHLSNLCVVTGRLVESDGMYSF
jgi:hypothetical protein